MSEVSSVTTYFSGLLAELNSEQGIAFEFSPRYTLGLRTAGTDSVGFKLCKRGEPQRILCLNLVDVYPQCYSEQRQRVKSELRSALLAFSDGKPTDPGESKNIIA
jgi:hypothetical protein